MERRVKETTNIDSTRSRLLSPLGDNLDHLEYLFKERVLSMVVRLGSR